MHLLSIQLMFVELFFISVSSDKITEHINRVKRAEINLQTCIENFNVHRDKIIRTQDSQNMGAKYLNEMDLGTREECLRLCCETESCDVFVFEEKNSGSCYLFHCGPPDYFKCKFTHHTNYSSGVLAVSRQLPDLESQIKLTKHEQDLTKLRKPQTAVTDVKTTFATTTTTMASKETVLEVKNNKVPEEARKCNRFQFECRSTGECIAIYNACDGILQCTDGSDEAVELGCPDSATTASPTQAAHTNSQPAPVRYDPNQQSPPQPLHPNSNMHQLPRDPPQMPPLLPHASEDFLRPVSDPRLYDPQSIYHEPPPLYHNNQLQQYAQTQQQQIQSGWGQPQMPVGQPIPQYADKNSHIFTHKETGYQVPDGQEMSQMQYSETLSGKNYPKMNGYYDVNYRQPVQQENWPLDEGAYETQQKFLPPENVQDHNRNKPAPEYVPQPQPANTKQETSVTQQVNPPHVQEKLAHDLKHSKDNMEHGDVQPQKIKTEHHHEQYPDVVAYRIVDNDLQDGVAQTPRGAVLSVTLGLIITAIMAIMIGCRLKMVRRRLRKGGKAYAHDADFLVNGMYL